MFLLVDLRVLPYCYGMLDGNLDGRTVRHLRLERHMRQTELARAVGISDHWLRCIELHSHQPSEVVARKLAHELNVSVAELLVAEEQAA